MQISENNSNLSTVNKVNKTVTKCSSGRRANILSFRGLTDNSQLPTVQPFVYRSATGAAIVKIKGTWYKLIPNRSRRHGAAIVDLRKPYKFPTRRYKTESEKKAEKKAALKEARARARKLLTKEDYKLLVAGRCN
jgi:hypothetical protein